MEDSILLSSGSEEDSDIEVLGIYKHNADEIQPVVKDEWSSYSPPYIDLSASKWTLTQRRYRRTGVASPGVVDLSDEFSAEALHPTEELGIQKREQRTQGFSSCLILESHLQFSSHSSSKLLEKKETTHKFFGDITESLQCSPNYLPTEPLEEGKSQECPNKSPNHLPEKFMEEDGNPESPKTVNLESSQSPQLNCSIEDADKEETTANYLNTIFNNLSVPVDPPVSCTSSVLHLGSFAEDAMGMKETKLGSCAGESELAEFEKEGRDEPKSLENADTIELFPMSPYSPYYCPSEVDLFSDNSSLRESQQDNMYTGKPYLSPTDPVLSLEGILSKGLSSSTMSSCSRTGASSDNRLGNAHHLSTNAYALSRGTDDLLPEVLSPRRPSTDSLSSNRSVSSCTSKHQMTEPFSPYFTDVLDEDSADWLVEDAELPINSPPSPLSLPSSPTFQDHSNMDTDLEGVSDRGAESPLPNTEHDASGEEVEVLSDSESGLRARQASEQDRHYVSRAQFKKLKLLMSTTPQVLASNGRSLAVFESDEDDEEEGFGPAEPLCRQSVSLVNITIQENYPEGTLQLLSDFLHPRFYPPANVTAHLLNGILLNTQHSLALVTGAHCLMMRIQKYHPAEQSTVQWDWELLTSVMDSQRHQSAVLRMMLQYVLQTLEDDFHRRVSERELRDSIVHKVLSCDSQFTNVRSVISWLVSAVMNSKGDSQRMEAETEEEQQERDENLQMVFLLQKMLSLAMEVDRSPMCNSNKLSQELFQKLLSEVPLRQHRLLLLETLESRLLQCKLLELLLEKACPQKTPLPMSLKLLLHFLQNSKLAPDPIDGAERWQRWSELIHLLWMLLLSYGEVKGGHLRISITERSTYNRAPIHTVNDEITRTAVEEAADFFLSRVSADLGTSLPPQLHESFSCLQDQLFDACQH